MRNSLNIDALRTDYAKSCAERMEMRSTHILPPYFPRTPADYHMRGTEFMKIQKGLSAKQREMATSSFNRLSPHIKDLAYMQGVVYVAPRLIAQAIPNLKDDPGYYNDNGLYTLEDRRIYLPVTYGVIRKAKNGGVLLDHYVDSTRDRHRMITHESGHAVDDILGNYSLDENEERRLTARADFLAAFDADIRALLTIRNLPRNETIMERRYYLPATHDGHEVGGMHTDPKRARREVFAELWASINSKSTKRLPEIYPRTYAFVQEVNTVLSDLHDEAPVRCTYTLDGKAVEQKIKLASKKK